MSIEIKEPIKLKQARQFDWQTFQHNLKFYFLLVCIVIGIFMLLFGIIKIYIFETDQSSNFLFTIFNALVFGAYFNLLGIFNLGIKNKQVKYVILIILVIIVLLGFTYFNIVFEFNFPFFAYKLYSTANEYGIYFYLLNNLTWLVLYGLSFTIESEV